MNGYLVVAWTWIAALAMSYWEAYVEGRNAWDKGKLGWKFSIGGYVFSAYHFWAAWVMWPVLLATPLIVNGWDPELFGILLSAFASCMVIEDFFWYVVHPRVQLKELWSPFSDYYPWVRIGGKKILPAGYFIGIGVCIASWYFLWM